MQGLGTGPPVCKPMMRLACAFADEGHKCPCCVHKLFISRKTYHSQSLEEAWTSVMTRVTSWCTSPRSCASPAGIVPGTFLQQQADCASPACCIPRLHALKKVDAKSCASHGPCAWIGTQATCIATLAHAATCCVSDMCLKNIDPYNDVMRSSARPEQQSCSMSMCMSIVCHFHIIQQRNVQNFVVMSSPPLHPVDPKLRQFCKNVLPPHCNHARKSSQNHKGGERRYNDDVLLGLTC